MGTVIRCWDETRPDDAGEATITDNYCVIVDGTATVTHTAVHANGTVVVTIKGVKLTTRAGVH